MSIPSGKVYLVRNALVDRNYGHTISFKNSSEQLAYWGFLVKYSVEKDTYSYLRKDTQEITVPYKIDDILDINYLYFKASEDSKYYFCFVDDKKYISDNATKLIFHVDVLQTYMFDYTVLQSYVLQEHTERWDADHKPIYSRTDEGLAYGDEYTLEAAYKITDSTTLEWYLAVTTPNTAITSSGASSEGTAIPGIANPYQFYLLPSDTTKSDMFKLAYDPTGDTSAIGSLTTFMDLMSKTSLGNYVQQIVKLPYIPFSDKISVGEEGGVTVINTIKNGVSGLFPSTITIDSQSGTFISMKGIDKPIKKLLAEMDLMEGIESALPTDEQWAEVVKNPYTTERDRRFESKLLTYPYRYNLLTDWVNTPAVIKNEYVGSDKLKIGFMQGISFNSPARYWVEGYKKDPEGRATSVTRLISEEAPVINDQYYTYLLQNKNQIQANQTNAVISSVTSVASNVIGGAMFGGPAGAISSGISGAVGGALNYQAMIRSENGKQKDLKNLPDTIVNSNDGAFNTLDDNRYLTLYRYKICCEFEEMLAETWAMTGYTVKRLKVPNLKTRARYNYVKTLGANIVGNFDQSDLSLIKQIFDNGITFWHYNDVNFKPFDYSLENIERKLIKE